MYPSREEFTELIYYISELKHSYSNKIDEQTIKINDQSGVMEELLWQIRELSDKLRQMSHKVIELEKQLAERRSEESTCVCRYENCVPTVRSNRSIFSRHNSAINRKTSAKIAKSGEKLSDANSGLSKCLITSLATVDKTIDDDDSRDDNDVYETIEFSDSSSHVYTEPVQDYGALRRVNIKTSPKQSAKKPPSGLKKSVGSRNLHKFSAMQDISTAGADEEENVQLRTKPQKPIHMDSSEQQGITQTLSVGLRNENLTPRY
jgi:hypothetical protein